MNRASTGPVTGEPSGFFATGTWMVWFVAVGVTSPCHPLTSEMCPSGLGAARPFPRFTTEYTRTLLAFERSTGFINENVATYDTLPLALRGASSMS